MAHGGQNSMAAVPGSQGAESSQWAQEAVGQDGPQPLTDSHISPTASSAPPAASSPGFPPSETRKINSPQALPALAKG